MREHFRNLPNHPKALVSTLLEKNNILPPLGATFLGVCLKQSLSARTASNRFDSPGSTVICGFQNLDSNEKVSLLCLPGAFFCSRTNRSLSKNCSARKAESFHFSPKSFEKVNPLTAPRLHFQTFFGGGWISLLKSD